MNVSLRHGGRSAWALTEQQAERVARGRDHIRLGESEVGWRDGRLEVRIDERTAPWGATLRGSVRLTPHSLPGPTVALDGEGAYRWRAHAPFATVEVELTEPRVTFRGVGYLDSNQSDAPLEDAFSSWTWSRAADATGATIAYDVVLRDGSTRRCGVELPRDGAARPETTSELATLPSSLFGLDRAMRSEDARATRLLRTVEDGPFYARSVVETSRHGRRAHGMHEIVSLDRFRAPWVQFLVPYRMRVARSAA